MKIISITEAGVASVDKTVGTAKDVASTASLGALASQLPKVPGAIKTVGKRALPGANMAYQGLDAAKRATAGDSVGSAIAAASMHPYLAIPGAIVQAGRDKIRTGSFMPDDEEIAAAAKKDKEAGGYWKARGSDYDPSYMPESKVMKSNRLQTAIIKEELELKKCSMNEDEIKNTIFIYKDRRGNFFTESGKHIDAKRLDEAPAWLKTGIDAAKTGWNALKTGGEWAAKNIPPAYRAVKSGIGKAAGEIGDVYRGIKKGVSAVGSEFVDVPVDMINKVKGGVQKVKYGTTDPLEIPKIQTARSAAKTAGELGDIEVKTAKGVGKQTVRKAGGEADVAVGTGREAMAKGDIAAGNVPWISQRTKTAAKFGTGAAAGVGAADVGLQYDPDSGSIPGGYSPGKGIGQVISPDEPTETNEAGLREKYEKHKMGEADSSGTLGQRLGNIFRSKKPSDKPAPEPAKPVKPAVEPAKPEPVAPEPAKPAPEPAKPAPEPAKPEPPKPEEKPDPRLSGDYTVNADPEAEKVPYTPRVQPKPGNDKVIAMQKKLKAAGYDLGSFGPEGDGIDGKWGKKTQAAYDAYKADKKLKQAGEPDAASRERERIAAQSNLQQAPKGSDTTTSGDSSSSTVSPSSNPDLSKEDPSVTAARAAAAEKLAQMQRFSDIAKAAREKPVSSNDQVGKTSPSANDNIDWKATAARDSLKNYEPYIPIKKSPTVSDDPIGDIIKQKQVEKVIPESVNTELNDILWLAGRHKR